MIEYELEALMLSRLQGYYFFSEEMKRNFLLIYAVFIASSDDYTLMKSKLDYALECLHSESKRFNKDIQNKLVSYYRYFHYCGRNKYQYSISTIIDLLKIKVDEMLMLEFKIILSKEAKKRKQEDYDRIEKEIDMISKSQSEDNVIIFIDQDYAKAKSKQKH